MWKLIREESRLGNRAAQSWTQKIEVTGDHISVHEEIVFGGRDAMKTTFVAAFDGKDYPVHGSALADTIAYTRAGKFHMSGIGKKAGATTLTETATVSADGNTLTLTFHLQTVNPQVPNSVAVFRRQAEGA